MNFLHIFRTSFNKKTANKRAACGYASITLEKKQQHQSEGSFNDGGSYHLDTSPLTCRANQWTGFYIIKTSVMTVTFRSGTKIYGRNA